jgi:phosphatidyl-myo-inositol dimannoside synthase
LKPLETRHSFRVAMLLSDGFGGDGGIAKFNRDFLTALDACVLVERIHVLPRVIADPIEQLIPDSIVYDRKAAAGKLAYLQRFFNHLLRPGHVDVVVCGHLRLLAPAWLLARFHNSHLVLIIHGIEAWKPSKRRISNWLAHNIDGLISVSRLSAERFSRWSNFPVERAFILPNCVDLKRFRPLPKDPGLMERYKLQSSRVIMTVGRLVSRERYKGIDELIEMMPRLIEWQPTVKYMIVGDGNDRPRLEAKVKSLKLSDCIIFAGRVPESELVSYYNLADVYAMPSRGEGFGIVLIEAAACGIPVIGGDKDGSREALLDGRLGQLVDPNDTKQLFDEISAVLANPRRRVRNSLVEIFSNENFSSRVVKWSKQIVRQLDHPQGVA